MFPPEIIDFVLSFLQWDRATLKVCAQVPSLSKLVERHLYTHLTVQTFTNFTSWTPDAYYPSELLKLTLDNPNIPKHVRSLRIDLSVSRGWFSLTRSYRELESILPALTQLQAIFLSSNPTTAVGWNELRDSFRTAFTDCLRLPTLTDVKVSNIDAFPLSALGHCGSLKRLLLLGNFHYLPSISSIPYPSLDVLVLYQCSSMETVTSWTEARSLRSLVFNGDFSLFSKLLEVCANTLTILKVHVPHTFRSRYYPTSNHSTPCVPLPFSLACLPHLEHLTIQSSISFTQQFWVNSTSDDSRELRLSHSCLPAIMDLLDTLPSPHTNLLCLLIDIDIDLDNSFDSVSEANWSPLVSFPYFDVIPTIELRVRAQKGGKQIPAVELLNTLKQDPHLMQLERHHSFLINPVEKPLDHDQLKDGYIDMVV